MKKLSDTEVEFKKSVAYEKNLARVVTLIFIFVNIYQIFVSNHTS